MPVIGIHILLGGPAEITVINDKMATVLRAERIRSDRIPIHILLAYAKTDIADDEVLRTAAVDLIMGNDDTEPRRCLTGDRVVLAVDTQVFDEPYLTCYRKTDGNGFVRVLLHCPTERSFGFTVRIVRECGHINHFAASTAGGIFTESFRAGKGN